MDEPLLGLAILSLGTFVGVLVTAFAYVTTVRPRLLEPTEDHLRTALDDQNAIVDDLRRELASQTELLSGYVDHLQQQRQLQDAMNAELQAMRNERHEWQVAQSDLPRLLADHQTLLDRLHRAVDDNRLSLKAQRRLLAQQLRSNDTILRQLAHLVRSSAPDEGQLGEVLIQLDELAKLVREAQAPRSTAPARRTAPRQERPGQDRLTDIKGIGPVFSGLLHEAGIHKFEQLAEMTSDSLDALLNLPKWRKANTQDWIDQARALVEQRHKAED